MSAENRPSPFKNTFEHRFDEKEHEFYFHSIPLNELELLYCGYEHCNPGHKYGPTMRDHFYYHFVVSGKGIVRSNRQYTVNAGSGFFGLPYHVMYYEADQDDPWTYLWIAAKGDILMSLYERFSGMLNYPIITHKKPDRICAGMEQLLSGVQDPSLPAYFRSVGNFFSLLSMLYEDAEPTPCRKNACRSGASKSYVEKAREFIQNNYAKDINMQTIAQYVGIDEDYLARIFKRELNTTPTVFLQNYRLGLAYKMLLNTNMSVREIAFAVGIQDPQYFSRCFSRQQGISPRELRRSLDKNGPSIIGKGI